jgi:hypothetical protein
VAHLNGAVRHRIKGFKCRDDFLCAEYLDSQATPGAFGYEFAENIRTSSKLWKVLWPGCYHSPFQKPFINRRRLHRRFQGPVFFLLVTTP